MENVRRQWQKYLGKLEDIAKACVGGGLAPLYAELFQWGLPTALWKESLGANIVDEIDQLCPKRDQGLSTGAYIAIAAVNRAIQPDSKRFDVGVVFQDRPAQTSAERL